MFIARQIFVSDKMTTRLFGYDSVRLTIEMEDCPASPLIKAIFKARRLTLHGVSKKRRKTYKRSRNNPSNHRLAKSITTAPKMPLSSLQDRHLSHSQKDYVLWHPRLFVCRAQSSTASTIKEIQPLAGKRTITAHTESKTNLTTIKKGS